MEVSPHRAGMLHLTKFIGYSHLCGVISWLGQFVNVFLVIGISSTCRKECFID